MSALPRFASGVRRRNVPSTDLWVDVLPHESIAPITGNHYGHFIEHLGGVIYDGIWVGERSKIPNIGGIRKSLVDDLRVLTPGVIRWPGGCFADSYDWKDGIGPRPKRPSRLNYWSSALPNSVTGPARYEDNQFGTPEFMQLCKMVGAQPYLAVNARSATALDFAQWVEYCNAPRGTTTLAKQREADGVPEPYNVRYWGIGNEPWGCGGRLRPEEYAEEYRRFSAWVPWFPPKSELPRDQEAVMPRLIAGGPEGTDYEWTQKFLAVMDRSHVRLPYGLSIHDYFDHDDDVFSFNASGWYTMLLQPQLFADILQRHAAAVDQGVKAVNWPRPVTLILDEWGPCYHSTGLGDPSHLLEQVPTMRDALLSSLMFDLFHAHADVLSMTTVAQSVNCLQSLFLTSGEKYTKTPVYHAFALYQPHIGGTSVRTVASSDRISYADEKDPHVTRAIDGVSASATRHTSADGAGHIVVTVTNPRMDQPASATVSLRGVTIASGEVTQLAHGDPHAHNTFEAPETVRLSETKPLALSSSTPSGMFTLTLPPASITRIICKLGR